MTEKYQRLPEWLRNKQKGNQEIMATRKILKKLELESVCENARCPNLKECFARKMATFMILGKICTRNCSFCAVKEGQPCEPDPREPLHLTQAVAKLNLVHVVITSVTRDDLEDGGAGQFARCLQLLAELDREVTVEVLTPDFQMNTRALDKIINARPVIFNHNLETVSRLYEKVRPQAGYQRSLAVLKYVKEQDNDIYTKSGIMVGLGETGEEIIALMQDLRDINCDILTIGQYLQPGKDYLPVSEYLSPEEFSKYEDIGLKLGFKHVAAGPLVRSSYQAGKLLAEL